MTAFGCPRKIYRWPASLVALVQRLGVRSHNPLLKNWYRFMTDAYKQGIGEKGHTRRRAPAPDCTLRTLDLEISLSCLCRRAEDTSSDRAKNGSSERRSRRTRPWRRSQPLQGCYSLLPLSCWRIWHYSSPPPRFCVDRGGVGLAPGPAPAAQTEGVGGRTPAVG
jgi:hypothetical protein